MYGLAVHRRSVGGGRDADGCAQRSAERFGQGEQGVQTGRAASVLQLRDAALANAAARRQFCEGQSCLCAESA
ncbi:Uncharacterised protein [Mycobacteroides abscessus subsp. massiliense]|nr:Uncharacterised protein [Mycobacteroides abscessus subsp. massiliense]